LKVAKGDSDGVLGGVCFLRLPSRKKPHLRKSTSGSIRTVDRASKGNLVRSNRLAFFKQATSFAEAIFLYFGFFFGILKRKTLTARSFPPTLSLFDEKTERATSD
jgi:hypothetical protein